MLAADYRIGKTINEVINNQKDREALVALDLSGMMKQVQKMQEGMGKLQEELAHKTVSATAGGGMVKAVVNGKLELVSLTIEKEVINPDDAEMLNDLVMAAVNAGLRRAQELAMEETQKLTCGIADLSGLLAGVR